MSNLDVSLDDLIKQNKKSGGGGGGRRAAGGRNSGPGPARRLPNRNRSTPYSVGQVQAPETTWQHDMFADHAGGGSQAQPQRVSAIETGTKLIISNLDYGVSNDDIKELFSDAGDLKRYSIHYDRSGRSKGTAEVVFSRRRDAEAAVKRYNGVQLDGKPMKIEIVGTNIATPAAQPPSTNGMYGAYNGAPRSQGRGGGGGSGRPRDGGNRRPQGGGDRGPRGGDRGGSRRGGRGGGGGRGGRGEKVSAEDLDADLEKYHAESMQTN